MNALKQMEAFYNQQQLKPEPGELVKESVVEMQRGPAKRDLRTFRRRRPEAVFKSPFAAWRGNTFGVSEKEKQRLDLRRAWLVQFQTSLQFA